MKSYFKFRSTSIKICHSTIIAIVIAFFAMFIDACQEIRPPNLSVLILMKSSVNSIAQLYYDTGKGLNEQESIAVNVSNGNSFQILQFNLPTDTIYYLRFDPIRGEGAFEIKNVKIGDSALQTIQKIDLHSIEQLQQIEQFEIKNEIACGFTTRNGNDPMLYFNLDYPIRSSRFDYIAEYFKTVPKKVVVIFILSFVAMLFAIFNDDFELTAEDR